MMLIRSGLCACVLLFGAEMADAAPPSFLKDYAETNGFMNGRPASIQFSPDGKVVYFLRSGPRDRVQALYRFDIETKKTEPFLTAADLLGEKDGGIELTPEEKARRERQRQSAKGIASYSFVGDKSLLVPLAGKLFLVNSGDKTSRQLKTPGTLLDPQPSPDGSKIGYVVENDLYFYDVKAGAEKRVTSDGTVEKPYGLAEFVAQEEMARSHGFWWSPDGKELLYQKSDHSGVEQWHVSDPLHPERAGLPQYYPRPGKKNVKVELYLTKIAGSELTKPKTIFDTGTEQYLAAVHWEEHVGLRILAQDRSQQSLTQETLFGEFELPLLGRERANGWLNIRTGIAHWAGKAGFWTTSDEGASLAYYPLDVFEGYDNKPDYAVSEAGAVHSIVRVDSTTRAVYFVASKDPTSPQVWRYTPDAVRGKGKLERVSPIDASSTAVVSKKCELYAITSTTPEKMPVTKIFKADGSLLGELPTVAEEPSIKPSIEFQYVGGEKNGFFTAIVKPHDFDANKKYPVVLHVYGGPTHLMVQRAMRPWLLDQWLADQGFIIAAIDNRGTPGRTLAWEQAVYQKFDSVPLADQVEGLKKLGDKFPFMDLDRVGVHGWSFGGYMAAQSVLVRPDTFKAAIAGAPVTDWKDYDTHYTERYLGLLPESEMAYKAASLIPLAKNLKSPLLLVHGTADDNVYFRHSLKLADALFRAGKEFEMLPLPGLTHMVPDPVILERLWGRYAKFFKSHLGESGNPTP